MTTSDSTLEVSRLIKASQERVFAAWTDPALIVQWWGAGGVKCTAAEFDLVVGGTYRIANQAPDETTMWIAGTFSRVSPPSAVSYTWAMEPITDGTIYSLVEVQFEARDEGTLVTVIQTQITSPEARESFLHGWLGCLDGLEQLMGT